jgi:hypothetical protein
MVNLKVCPDCGSELMRAFLPLDVFISDVKVGTLEQATIATCSSCKFDALVLKVAVTAEGIYIDREDNHGNL